MRHAFARMIVLFLLACGTVGAVPAAATADFITYSLNESNTLPDGAYGTVKVESNTGLGEVKLTFTAATDPYSSLGPNFGFHTIGFNTDLDLKAANFTLPAGWKLTGGANLSSFGKFTWKVSASKSQLTSLTIQIDGLGANATAAHFALPSTGGDSVFFAGQVMDFKLKGSDVTGHWIGGSAALQTPIDPPTGQGDPPAQTPEPSSLLLGAAAAAGMLLTRMARRRRTGPTHA